MKRSDFKIIMDLKLILMVLLTFVYMLGVSTKTNGSASPTSSSWSLEALTQESKQTEVRELKLGVPIERELAGGSADFYSMTLTSGQYLHPV